MSNQLLTYSGTLLEDAFVLMNLILTAMMQLGRTWDIIVYPILEILNINFFLYIYKNIGIFWKDSLFAKMI